MDLKKMSLILPAALLMSAGAFADETGSQPPRRQQQQQQQDQDQNQDQGQGQYQGQYQGPQAPCGQCGYQQPMYNPSMNYYCGPQCGPPVLPFPPPIAIEPYPIYPTPYYGPPPAYLPGGNIYPPMYGQGPVYGRGPYYGRGGMGFRPPFYGNRGRVGHGRPGFRRMSLSGCEVQQGNNGEAVVLSSEGNVLYSDRSSHALENADAMKSYYLKSDTGLCIDASAPATKTQDI